uniref:hypothetical protein n=1 Tax=Ningiella ruwaisensis TaxID=2364274 RepID=UPI00109F6133|nr:hypothetical protein [Ningiella ruwaisensis]
MLVLFSVLAISSHLLLLLAALLNDLILGKGESIWAILLLCLYLAGAWVAAFIARLNISFIEQRAFFKLAEVTVHSSYKLPRNRWFIALPICFFLSVFALGITSLGLGIHKFYE